MKIRNTLVGLYFFLLGAAAFRAESAASAAPAPVLSLSWSPPAGDSLVLSVRVALPEGWYINSHAPLDSFLVATRVEARAPGLEFGPPRYPAPVVEHSRAMAGNMSLFKGDFEVAIAARVPASGKKKTALPGNPPPVRVVLHYQSCDGNMCWPPKSVSAVLENGVTRGE